MDQQAAGSQGSKPRSYTEDYKRQVVDLVVSTGRTATSVAAEVGIHHTLLSRWVRQYGQPAGSSATTSAAVPPQLTAASSLKPVSVLHADQAAEIARLRRENDRLRMERDILKKGIAIFAVPSR
jgi:transposase